MVWEGVIFPVAELVEGLIGKRCDASEEQKMKMNEIKICENESLRAFSRIYWRIEGWV